MTPHTELAAFADALARRHRGVFHAGGVIRVAMVPDEAGPPTQDHANRLGRALAERFGSPVEQSEMVPRPDIPGVTGAVIVLYRRHNPPALPPHAPEATA